MICLYFIEELKIHCKKYFRFFTEKVLAAKFPDFLLLFRNFTDFNFYGKSTILTELLKICSVKRFCPIFKQTLLQFYNLMGFILSHGSHWIKITLLN